MKVLFDWDQPHLSGLYAIKRGIKLIVFGICKTLKLRPTYVEEIYRETDDYAQALSQINELCGIQTIYGIRDHVRIEKSDTIEKLKEKNDIRRHTHIGEAPDPNRTRRWEPPLQQTKDTWYYDEDYYNGHEVPLKEGELPVFHVDRPYRLQTYIKFLYEHRSWFQ